MRNSYLIWLKSETHENNTLQLFHSEIVRDVDLSGRQDISETPLSVLPSCRTLFHRLWEDKLFCLLEWLVGLIHSPRPRKK